MVQHSEEQPTHFAIHRSGERPEGIDLLGRQVLTRVITVTPPPQVSDTLLVALRARSGVIVDQLNRSDTEAVFEVRTDGQTIESWAQIQRAIRVFGAILNAAIDPHAYIEAAYSSPTQN